jgi:hypothetical protein
MRFDRSEKDDVKAAREWGIDVSLLEANLQRSPTERLVLHQQSLATAERLQEAVKNASAQRHPQTPAAK